MTNKKVGYKQPPVEHQWKPGQSGNPTGKKSKKKPAQPLVEEIACQLNEPVSLTIGGKAVELPLSRALAKHILQSSLKASVTDQIKILKLLATLGVFSAQADLIAQNDEDAILEYTEEDRRLLLVVRGELGIED